MEAILPPVPGSLAAARRMVGRMPALPGGVLEDAKLVLTELLANEIKHGRYRPGEALICRVGRRAAAIRIEVRHPGAPFRFPATRVDLPLQTHETGWGLALITRLADRWGVDEAGGSRKVWAEIDLPRAG